MAPPIFFQRAAFPSSPPVPSQSIISSISWHGCSTLDTRSSPPTMIGERRREEGEMLKRGIGTRVFVALSSRPHTASPVDTQLCVATRHDTNVGGKSSEADLVWRRFFRGNKGYQAFIIRQRRVGRASGVIHDSLENARGSGNGNRFGNLFAPSHSVQLLSLVGIRNCVKLRANSRWIFILFSFFFWLFCSLEISWNVSFALLF